MKRFVITFLICLCFDGLASAQTTTVWQIGKFDQSYLEFSAAFRDHVLYQVGKSDWTRDWPGEQRPGSSYEIAFNLNSAPKGTFSLKVSILMFLPRIPALQVQVNRHSGLYYLHPDLSYVDDQLSQFDPHNSSDVISIEIPAEYLKVGANSLTLSSVLTQPPYEGQSELSGIHYDAISLTNNLGATYDKTTHAEVVPTIFYRLKSGHLVEVVNAFLRFGEAAPAGSAILTLHGERYAAEILPVKDFGEQKLEFEVPEWSGTASGQLEITAGMQTISDVSLTAMRKWTIFVVPHIHVDVGYTDYQGKVANVQARALDEAAELIKKYPDFRFSTDGSWNLEQYLATRSRTSQEEILNLVRDNKIGVPAQYVNLLTGYASLETIYRSLYYSKSLSRQYNIPFNYANTTDVPTYTGAYPSILASAGIKYWAVGGNNGRGPLLAHEQWNEKSPFWWEGPDGKKVLFWYASLYQQTRFLFGLPPQQAAIDESLPIFLQAYSKPNYKPNVALIYGTQGENQNLVPETATFATTWNQNYAYPKLQYATFQDFFRYLDKNYGDDLPTYKGDMGPYWEDGIGSDAYYAAEDRRNQSNALSAEILSTVSHTVDPNLHPPKLELEDAWNNIVLFAEHTWTAGNSVLQPDTDEVVRQLAAKDNRAVRAKIDIEDVANQAMGQLVDQIHVPADTLVVFNTLNWKRNALIETDLHEKQELVDIATNQVVPIEVVSDKNQMQRVRFLASDLPPVGYKCFQIRSVANRVSNGAATEKHTVIENKYYRITVDPLKGAVKSIFDKQLERELVNAHSPYGFGQYLYVTGGDGKTQIIYPRNGLPLAKLTIHPSISGQYLGAVKTPWGYSIRLRSSDVNTPAIDLEILLYDSEKKIEFRYKVQKDYTTNKEAVYFAFPVATASPQFAYATQQGWVDPAKDMLKGASLEWFSIQKWMAAVDPHFTVGIVPVDASLASFGDINRGKWPGEFSPASSTIFSYAMNNYWFTNYRAGQGGNFTFRYVLTSADHFDPTALTRVGLESMEQPQLDQVIGHNRDKVGNPDKPLPAEGASFLGIDASNIALVTWKLAEDGNGTILRLQETAGRSADATLSFPHTSIYSADLCNAVEDKLQDLKVSRNQVKLIFHPHEVLTIRLTF
jgi:alpha-mannosidase